MGGSAQIVLAAQGGELVADHAQTTGDRAREARVGEEEGRNLLGHHAARVAAPKGLVAGGRAQERHPVETVGGRAGVLIGPNFIAFSGTFTNFVGLNGCKARVRGSTSRHP